MNPAESQERAGAATGRVIELDLDHRLHSRLCSLGAYKRYDTRDFVQAVRLLGITPHVAQTTSKRALASRMP